MKKETLIRVIARSGDGTIKDIVVKEKEEDIRDTILYNGEIMEVVDVLQLNEPVDLSRYLFNRKRK